MPNRVRCPTCNHPVDREITAELLASLPIANPLTQAECRTLVLATEGGTNKEIANDLGTTEQVVKNRMKDIYNKIGVDKRAELIRRLLKFLYEGK